MVKEKLFKITVVTPTIRGKAALKRCEDSLEKQTLDDFQWLVGMSDLSKGVDFNQTMNELIRRSDGELIVSLQDYTAIKPDGLEQFWCAYKKYPDTFFTAPVWRTVHNIEFDKDWRNYRDVHDELDFKEWEIDWAAAPKHAIIDIGGFDEELDKHWGFDNVNIGLRAVLGGYKIRCLKDNVAIAWDHNKELDHPFQKLRNPDFHNYRLNQIRRGVEIKYL